MYQNIPGLLSGFALVTIGLHLIWIALKYYKALEKPGKKLAWRFLISISLFTVGSIGVVIDSLTEIQLWFIMAIIYPISYFILASSVGFYLKALLSKQAKPIKPHKKAPVLPISGAYSLRKPVTPQTLAYLSRISSGLLVISRTKKERWVKKYRLEPDEFVWLSNMEEETAISPTKLHVIQGKILQFLNGSGGKAVVYMEGVEYLVIYNDFPPVAKFLFSVKDYVISHKSVLIAYIPHGILDKSQESIILKEFKEAEEEELLNEISQKLLVTMVEQRESASVDEQENVMSNSE